MKVWADWPDVADVIVDLEDLPAFVPNIRGFFAKGVQIDLTEKQARELAEKLIEAYQETRKRKQEFDEYCKAHNIKEGD